MAIIHCAIFKPHLNDCIEAWVNTYKNNINQVFIPHKKLYELSVMLGHWTIILKCFVN